MRAAEPKDTWISDEYLPYINRISYQYHKRTMELERLHEEKRKGIIQTDQSRMIPVQAIA